MKTDRRGRPKKRCDNPLCVYQVNQGVMYCCPSCDWSHQQAKEGNVFDPHHTKECYARHEAAPTGEPEEGEDELLPCPFCGSDDVRVLWQRSGDIWWTLCFNLDMCGACGPGRETRDEAIAAWNRRTGVHDGHCTTCGNPVEVVSTDEGTSYYRPREESDE